MNRRSFIRGLLASAAVAAAPKALRAAPERKLLTAGAEPPPGEAVDGFDGVMWQAFIAGAGAIGGLWVRRG